MPTHRRTTASLALLASLLLVSACAMPARTFQSYPPAADLKAEAQPVLDPAAIGSDKALNDYDVAVETWGQRGWATVARVCKWAKTNGMKDAPC